MSHYNVNASVPKTLVQHLIRWQVHRSELAAEARATLQDVLESEITPELVPATAGGKVQSTEATIGPYELQDFNVYYITRFGMRPSKVAFLAHHAWGDKTQGHWPPGMRESDRREYDLATIKKWLRVFLFRFFKTSQFKRSAVPNSPKVGSGGSLSPRSDWRAPSDSEADVWLDELDRNVPS
jgi:NAD+ synthase (glutamine-hydrolysing)